MTLQRKSILSAVLGLLLLGWGGDRLWSKLMEPIENLRQKQEKLEREIEQRNKSLAVARKAGRELAEWNKQSLPSDPQVARSAYQAWLVQLVRRAGLENPAVDSTQPAPRTGYYSITFSVQARGALQEWTRFLFDFYRAGHLHQIRSMSITPIGNKEQLDVALAIEALILPDADRADQLSEEQSDRLAFAHLKDYLPIASRNLFSVRGSADPMDQTYLTAIQYVNGVPEAWFTRRGETNPDRSLVKVQVGAELSVGQFTGKVVEIARDDVVLESDGERWLVDIGQCLSHAFALPPEY